MNRQEGWYARYGKTIGALERISWSLTVGPELRFAPNVASESLNE